MAEDVFWSSVPEEKMLSVTKPALIFCSQVEAMKIGAKEMKRAYKDVRLDQIDVCLCKLWIHLSSYV